MIHIETQMAMPVVVSMTDSTKPLFDEWDSMAPEILSSVLMSYQNLIEHCLSRWNAYHYIENTEAVGIPAISNESVFPGAHHSHKCVAREKSDTTPVDTSETSDTSSSMLCATCGMHPRLLKKLWHQYKSVHPSFVCGSSLKKINVPEGSHKGSWLVTDVGESTAQPILTMNPVDFSEWRVTFLNKDGFSLFFINPQPEKKEKINDDLKFTRESITELIGVYVEEGSVKVHKWQYVTKVIPSKTDQKPTRKKVQFRTKKSTITEQIHVANDFVDFEENNFSEDEENYFSEDEGEEDNEDDDDDDDDDSDDDDDDDDDDSDDDDDILGLNQQLEGTGLENLLTGDFMKSAMNLSGQMLSGLTGGAADNPETQEAVQQYTEAVRQLEGATAAKADRKIEKERRKLAKKARREIAREAARKEKEMKAAEALKPRGVWERVVNNLDITVQEGDTFIFRQYKHKTQEMLRYTIELEGGDVLVSAEAPETDSWKPIIKTLSQVTQILDMSVSRKVGAHFGWEVGMKLKAKDRRHPELICVATVDHIGDIEAGTLIIHFDGWPSSYDCWVKTDSKDLHPIGYKDYTTPSKNLIRKRGKAPSSGNSDLQAPKGYQGSFSWEKYLIAENALAVPHALFSEAQTEGCPEHPAALKNISSNSVDSACALSKNRPAYICTHIMKEILKQNPATLNKEFPFCVLPQAIDAQMLQYPTLKKFWLQNDDQLYITCQYYGGRNHLVDEHGFPMPESVMQSEEYIMMYYMMKVATMIHYSAFMKNKNVFPSKIRRVIQSVDNWSSEKVESMFMRLYKMFICTAGVFAAFDKFKDIISNVITDRNQAKDYPKMLMEEMRKSSKHAPYMEHDGHPQCKAHRLCTEQSSQALKIVPMERFDRHYHLIVDLTLNNNSIQELPENFFQAFPNLLYLCLSDNQISALPSGLDKCPLQSLNIKANKLQVIPEEILGLVGSLIFLDISSNPINNIPAVVYKLTNLEELYVNHIILNELKPEIKNLTKLKVLEIGGSALRCLPKEIVTLEELGSLNVSGVRWIDLPERGGIVSVQAFTSFMEQYPILQHKQQALLQLFHSHDVGVKSFLDATDLQKFNAALYKKFPRLQQRQVDQEEKGNVDEYGCCPPEIFKMKNLQNVDLSYQGLRRVTKHFNKLPLVNSNFSYNPSLESVVGELSEIQTLKSLQLRACPSLKTPPKEIVAKGFKAVFGYLRRLNMGSVECKRTKLMMVGLGGAGKTSLVRSLKRSKGTDKTSNSLSHGYEDLFDFQLASRYGSTEAITDGIDITDWMIKGVTFSMWDFAGQTVYYNTHQFFMSNRAVYLLLWNIRLGYEHAGLDFWLSSIACHAPKAPILVVGTHRDQVEKFWLPTEELQARYPQIRGFHAISCQSKLGIEDLAGEIVSVALKEKYMGERIPEAWLNLEKAMTNKTRDSLMWEEVEAFADECGIVDKYEMNWPDVTTQPGSKETKMLYQFDYLPAGLFNRAQVRLYLFSDTATIWKRGSLLRKNGHMALMKQRDNTVHLKVQGPRPENVVFMVHEVFEGLMAESFHGVTYDYFVPCTDCIKAMSHDPCLFPASKIRWATEMKAPFLQCHKLFHTLSLHELHSMMPPDNSTDYDIHLERSLRDLDNLKDDLSTDVFMIYNVNDIPQTGEEDNRLHPRKIMADLDENGYKVWFPSDPRNIDLQKDTITIREAKMVLICISNNFVACPDSCRLFYFIKQNLQKNIQLVVLGNNFDWKQSDIGMHCAAERFPTGMVSKQPPGNLENPIGVSVIPTSTVARESNVVPQCDPVRPNFTAEDLVFVNMIDPKRYQHKIKELLEKVRKITQGQKIPQELVTEKPQCFISYCWGNSADAVKKGSQSSKEAIGWGDPRVCREYLEKHGIRCWIDVDNVGKGTLFEDIAQGLRHAKVMVVCVSDEYVNSRNCQVEFRFAAITLKIPMVIVIVGTGYAWEVTEVGMLSLGFPKVNLQHESPNAMERLLEAVKSQLPEDERQAIEQGVGATGSTPSFSPSNNNQLAFQELLELAQRKFLRQINVYTNEAADSSPYPQLLLMDFMSDSEIKQYKDAEMEQKQTELAERQKQELAEKQKEEEAEREEEEAEQKRDGDEHERKDSSSDDDKETAEKEDSGQKSEKAKHEETEGPGSSKSRDGRPGTSADRPGTRNEVEKVDGEEGGVSDLPSARPASARGKLVKLLKRRTTSKLNAHQDLLEEMEAEMSAPEYCIRFLCEHEEGWHVTDSMLILPVIEASIWDDFLDDIAPYMARLYAILKHTGISLPVLETQGDILRKTLIDKCGLESEFKKEYLNWRETVMSTDKDKATGGLSRCHLPSGKVLWLCEEHQKMERITVLSDDMLVNNIVDGIGDFLGGDTGPVNVTDPQATASSKTVPEQGTAAPPAGPPGSAREVPSGSNTSTSSPVPPSKQRPKPAPRRRSTLRSQQQPDLQNMPANAEMFSAAAEIMAKGLQGQDGSKACVVM